MNAEEIMAWLEVIKKKDDEILHWKEDSYMWNSKWQNKCCELENLRREQRRENNEEG